MGECEGMLAVAEARNVRIEVRMWHIGTCSGILLVNITENLLYSYTSESSVGR